MASRGVFTALEFFNFNFVNPCAHAHMHHLPKALGKSGCLFCSWETSVLILIPFHFSTAPLGGKGARCHTPGNQCSLKLMWSAESCWGGENRGRGDSGFKWLNERCWVPWLALGSKEHQLHVLGEQHWFQNTHPLSPWSLLLPWMVAGVWGAPFYTWGGNWPRCFALNRFIQPTPISKIWESLVTGV